MKFLIFIFVVYLVVLARPVDDTDKSRFTRSGMALYTDYGTGLQYLQGGIFGSTIPRLDKNGKHININKIKE